MINFQVKNINSIVQNIEIPDYINLSLMEVLKAWGYPIAATCRGIAQCATCHVVVLNGLEQLPEANDREIDTLDLLPDSDYKSRLACQIKADDRLNGCVFEVKGNKSLICGTTVVGSQ
jgi:2Fe-2S ferredoxin